MSAITTIINALSKTIPSLQISSGTIEAQIIDAVGTYADVEARERDNTLDSIREMLATQRVTNAEYYRTKATEFQLGDMLAVDSITQYPMYPAVDETKRIVKQAYMVGSFPDYSLLVNKVGSDGHLAPLTSEELASFTSYFAAFEPIGMHISTGSLPVARIHDDQISVYVQAGADGQAVCDAINAAFLAYEVIPRKYNRVTLSELVDVMQTAHPAVVAIGWGNVYAMEQLSGSSSSKTSYPVNGAFVLQNGAFTWATKITSGMLKVM